jgi:hypothetical protein
VALLLSTAAITWGSTQMETSRLLGDKEPNKRIHTV